MKVVKSVDDLFLPASGSVDLRGGTLRIPIRVISQKQQQDIFDKYKEPRPPVQPKKDGTGKMVFQPNENDPAWIAECDKRETERAKELFIIGIDIEFKGETVEEKWESVANVLTWGESMILLEAIFVASDVGDEAQEKIKNDFSRPPDTKTECEA